jgi:hypothetical protein
LLDLALDLYIPPLSRIAVGLSIGELAALGLRLGLGGGAVAVPAYAAGLGSVAAYVLRGWSVSGTGARGLADLAMAPVYVAWKMTLRFRKPARATSEWVRTEREQQPP